MCSIKGKILKSAFILTLLLFSSPNYAADAKPDDAIKYRKSAMKAVAGHFRAMGAILKGSVPHKDALQIHVDGFLLAVNKKMMADAFRQNTDGKGSEKSTSTAIVWKDWDKFEASLVRLETAAKKIQKAALEGKLTSFDQLKDAKAECGFCHRKAGFRNKKK